MRIVRMSLALLAVVLLATAPLAAHAFSRYFDTQKPISVTGTIVKVDWVDPNTFIHVRAEDKRTGQIEVWAFEAPPPKPMRGIWGLTADVFKEGDTITILGWQGKSGANLAETVADSEVAGRVRAGRPACAAQFEFADGRRVSIGSRVPQL